MDNLQHHTKLLNYPHHHRAQPLGPTPTTSHPTLHTQREREKGNRKQVKLASMQSYELWVLSIELLLEAKVTNVHNTS